MASDSTPGTAAQAVARRLRPPRAPRSIDGYMRVVELEPEHQQLAGLDARSASSRSSRMLRSARLDTVSRITASATCTTTSTPRPRHRAPSRRGRPAASTCRRSGRDSCADRRQREHQRADQREQRRRSRARAQSMFICWKIASSEMPPMPSQPRQRQRQRTARRRDRRQQQPFGHELPDQAALARAERGAHRQLARPRERCAPSPGSTRSPSRSPSAGRSTAGTARSRPRSPRRR